MITEFARLGAICRATSWIQQAASQTPAECATGLPSTQLQNAAPIFRAYNVVQLFQSYQNVTGLGPVGWPEDAGQLELINNPGRSAISDRHAALQEGRRPQLILYTDLSRLPEQWIPVSRLLTPGSFFSFFFGLFERRDLFVDGCSGRRHLRRGRVLLVPLHQPLGLVGRDECPLHTQRLALARWQEQHVAVAEQGFGAVLIEDRATIDFRRDAERDTAGKIRLDQTGDDVHRWPLRREHQMNPDRARFLRQHR